MDQSVRLVVQKSLGLVELDHCSTMTQHNCTTSAALLQISNKVLYQTSVYPLKPLLILQMFEWCFPSKDQIK